MKLGSGTAKIFSVVASCRQQRGKYKRLTLIGSWKMCRMYRCIRHWVYPLCSSSITIIVYIKSMRTVTQAIKHIILIAEVGGQSSRPTDPERGGFSWSLISPTLFLIDYRVLYRRQKNFSYKDYKYAPFDLHRRNLSFKQSAPGCLCCL